MLKYTKDHEWIETNGTTGTVGITHYAQSQLGDVVFVELTVVGRLVNKGEAVAVVESVKAASEIYAPVAGTIAEVNQALDSNPALVNNSPEKEGWFFKINLADIKDLDGLMDEQAYKNLVG
jgi:glycine cleavage system H protein